MWKILILSLFLIFIVETINASLLGGYTEFRDLSDDEKELFKKHENDIRSAKQLEDGVKLTPLKLKSQVVNGINYIFQVTQNKEGGLLGGAKTFFAKIYRPADENAESTLVELLLDSRPRS